MVTGGPDQAVGPRLVRTRAGSLRTRSRSPCKTLHSREHCARGQQCRLEAGGSHRRVRVQPSPAVRGERGHAVDHRGGVHQLQLSSGGHPYGSTARDQLRVHGGHPPRAALSRSARSGCRAPVSWSKQRSSSRPARRERNATTLEAERVGRSSQGRSRDAGASGSARIVNLYAVHHAQGLGPVCDAMASALVSVGAARFRVGAWQGSAGVAHVVPLTAAATLVPTALAALRSRLQAQGYRAIVTAAVAPSERDRLMSDGFQLRAELVALSTDLLTSVRLSRSHRLRGLRRGSRRDIDEVLQVDAAAFPPFWRLDAYGLHEARTATPSSRWRVLRGPEVMAYSVTGAGRIPRLPSTARSCTLLARSGPRHSAGGGLS